MDTPQQDAIKAALDRIEQVIREDEYTDTIAPSKRTDYERGITHGMKIVWASIKIAVEATAKH